MDYARERAAAQALAGPLSAADRDDAYLERRAVSPSAFDDTDGSSSLNSARGSGDQEDGILLIAAAKAGDVPLMHELLSAGAPVDRRAPGSGATALHFCCQRGAAHEAAMLLARGAPVNACDAVGWAPLHVAAFQGHSAVVKRLIASGADSSSLESESNKTALHLAAGQGRSECVLELLRARADVNAVNHAGVTPAHDAAEGGHAGSLSLLLSAGADPDGIPPLAAELALASKSFTAALRFTCGPLMLLGGGGGGGARRSSGPQSLCTPLHLAVTGAASVECVGILLAAGCAADAVDAQGNSALHCAAAIGDAELCERLIEGGATVDARSRAGASPLRLAAAGGHVAACMVLLAHGADPERVSADQLASDEARQLLAMCAEEQAGPACAVRLMLAQKAFVDGALDEDGLERVTSLVPACCAAAVALHALTQSLRRAAMTPEEAYERAEAAVASLASDVRPAAVAAHPLVFPLKPGGAGGAASWRDVAALHAAAAAGDAERLLELLGRGAGPNARDANGATPLHAAAAAGHARACRVLLAGGADIQLRRESGGEKAATVDGSLLFGRVAGLVASAGAEPGRTAVQVAVGEARAVLEEAEADLFIVALIDGLQRTAAEAAVPLGRIHAGFLAMLVTYAVCGGAAACGLLVAPSLRPSTRGDWIAGSRYAATWLLGMAGLYICFGIVGVVFGNIVQSTRGLFAIVIGASLAHAGWHGLETRIDRQTLTRRLLAAALMTAAIALYVLDIA